MAQATQETSMNIQSIKRAQSTTDDRLKACRQFFHQHGAAATNVSNLLGGERAQGRCIRLISELGEAQTLTRSHGLSLVGLHKLFTQYDAADFDNEDFWYVDIQPDDPRVEDICLLADRLFKLLVAIADDDEISAFLAQEMLVYAVA
tara:strand:+ start:1198 stop:1638 length:441 start_codon:yes stop_codon:yes gene_type:complete